MTQSPMPIWEEAEPAEDMEPDQRLEPVLPTTSAQYGHRGDAYLLGPASGAGMGVGPGVSIRGGEGFRVGGVEGEEILDPDGVVIGSMGGDMDGDDVSSEPNSPDKLGEGISLPFPTLPER